MRLGPGKTRANAAADPRREGTARDQIAARRQQEKSPSRIWQFPVCFCYRERRSQTGTSTSARLAWSAPIASRFAHAQARSSSPSKGWTGKPQTFASPLDPEPARYFGKMSETPGRLRQIIGAADAEAVGFACCHPHTDSRALPRRSVSRHPLSALAKRHPSAI